MVRCETRDAILDILLILDTYTHRLWLLVNPEKNLLLVFCLCYIIYFTGIGKIDSAQGLSPPTQSGSGEALRAQFSTKFPRYRSYCTFVLDAFIRSRTFRRLTAGYSDNSVQTLYHDRQIFPTKGHTRR